MARKRDELIGSLELVAELTAWERGFHLCSNCKQPQNRHVQGKCLFEATTYRPMTEPEYAAYVMRDR